MTNQPSALRDADFPSISDASATASAPRVAPKQTRGTILFFLPGLTAGGSEHVVTFNANRLVANGYDVYPDLVGMQLTMAIVYALSASVAAYFFLKTREIAG